MRTAFSAPMRSSSWTKYVLTDLPKPVHMFCTPTIAPLALWGHQNWPQVDPPPPGYLVMMVRGELIGVFSGRPFSSAASMVNTLNVDPAW